MKKGKVDVLKANARHGRLGKHWQRLKTKNKGCYLERKLQPDNAGSCSYKVKCQKTVERTYLWTRKKLTRYRWCF